MSGTAFVPFAHYDRNDQLDLMYDTFQEELKYARDPQTLLNFMKNAPASLLVAKTPAVDTSYQLFRPYWSTVIEGLFEFVSIFSRFVYIWFTQTHLICETDERKAIQPFLTQTPRQIYQTSKIDTEIIFGINSAASVESL